MGSERTLDGVPKEEEINMVRSIKDTYHRTLTEC